jgi:hypothetical protein
MVIRINWVGFLMMTTPSNPKLKRRKSISEALPLGLDLDKKQELRHRC